MTVGAVSNSQAGPEDAEPALFQSRRLTPPSEYPDGIEGPAVDASGNLYVVNFQITGTIGRLRPGAAKSELFAKLHDGSIGNGIRFDREGRMYVADYKKHNVFVFEPGDTEPRVYFSGPFHQPNDLAIAADGTLYASDPDRHNLPGQIWRITRGPDGKGHGEVMSCDRQMGRTNGIDLSPDGQTLYVGESGTCELWAYRLQGAKLIAPSSPLKKFSDPPVGGVPSDIDGLRTDIDGRIFVTRISQGRVTILKPDGQVEREVPLLGKEPSNLTFGGPDGRTVFVTQGDGKAEFGSPNKGGFVEAFRVERPGREPFPPA
jgi:sugar lactone lactonase YvrE